MQGFIIACFMMVTVMSQIDLIPVEYGLPFPFNFEENKNEIWSQFDMCQNPPYQNCYVTTRVNLPQKKWDVNAGYYVNLQVFSGMNGQCTLVAQNNINSASPNIADFMYVVGVGNRFYVRMSNSVGTGFVGTLDVRITCDASQKVLHGMEIKKQLVIPCGQSPTMMSMSYRPIKPLVFPTSVGFEDWLQMKIPVCLGDQFNGLRYKGLATDTYSAASTRACSFSPCTAAADAGVDRSGSAINSFDIPNFTNRTLFLAFEGWGTFGESNNFSITLEAI